MTQSWNKRKTAVSCASGGAASTQVLRAVSIAAVAWLCIFPAASKECPIDAPERPIVRSLPDKDNEEFLKGLVDFLNSQDIGVDNVKTVVMTYAEGDTDKLVAFKFDGSPAGEECVEYYKGDLMIPGAGLAFDKVMIVYTGSNATVKSCSGSGGTPYCNFPP